VTWSYSGNPASSTLDTVRFYINDTDETQPLLSNEDIQFLLDLWMPIYKSPLLTSAVAAEVVAGKFARQVSVSADGVSVSVSELQEKYNDLAYNLREMYKLEEIGTPVLPGIIYDPVWDPTIKPTRFGIGFTDNYLAGRQDYGNYDPDGYPNGWVGPDTHEDDEFDQYDVTPEGAVTAEAPEASE